MNLKETTIMDYITQPGKEFTIGHMDCDGDIDIITKFPLTINHINRTVIVKASKLFKSGFSSVEVVTGDIKESENINKAIDSYIEIKLGVIGRGVLENITMLELYRLIALNLDLKCEERLMLNIFDPNLQ